MRVIIVLSLVGRTIAHSMGNVCQTLLQLVIDNYDYGDRGDDSQPHPARML